MIAPNIIVLDRLYRDFQGLRIFFTDPVIPGNGFDGRNWQDDFQLTLHKQDEVTGDSPGGKHFPDQYPPCVFRRGHPPVVRRREHDGLLPRQAAHRAPQLIPRIDLGMIVRDIDELMVLNDEAHHIHDSRMAWFKSIEDIHNRLLQKGSGLSLQVDVTATPKHNNGAIFVQTVADYPLVEAISQNVVKHPVLPDAPSRSKLAGAAEREVYREVCRLP